MTDPVKPSETLPPVEPVAEADPKSDHPNYPFEAEKLSVPERLLEIAAALRVSSPSGVETLADELAAIAGEM